ncbi:MAG: helix-turn-helix transcriptional regulator [Winogradskyella sp.]|uniref:helix-turn-helix domain-containing protein n=1 Tax=Winogradskyella sp. TaxID=1883156 RepID=UPI0017F60FDB|nr:helix-turn-helix transcriptional regulator [Winogradskyella sp.]MBT8246152.1 helix-turn-helix transcriptional regulator [Winogradskyella sp.]NNK23736.1 helix-turn-helix transcriptional regulator [Winogradskyella sp.]
MPRRKEKITSPFGIATSNFFREKRIALGLSQTELAYLVFGNKSYQFLVSDIENHMKSMNQNVIDKYCKVFNCEVVFVEKAYDRIQ